MSIVYHERPGVYSDYTVSGVSLSAGRAKTVALIGYSEADAGLYVLNDPADAAAFGESSELGKMVKLAYQNGAGTILAYPVAADTETAYTTALECVLAEKQASFCVVGSCREDVQEALRDAVEDASVQRGECIGLCGMLNATKAELIARAAELNSERMVLIGPDVYLPGSSSAVGGGMAAAALAGCLTDQSDPAAPLNGQVLRGLTGVNAVYDDTEIDALVAGGVTVLECFGGRVSVMRGITTRTTTGGTADRTFRELSTVLIIDDVIPSIRTALKTKFARAKNNALTRNAIRSQVVVELEERIARQVIESYDHLTVTASADDPTICVVEFEFAVVHGLNRIFLTAHISV